MPETRQGIDCKLYIDTTPDASGGPTLVEVDLVSDLSFPSAWDEGDSSARRSLIKTAEPTMLDIAATGRVRKKVGDAGYDALREAHLNRTTVRAVVVDGPEDENGVVGFCYDAKVTQFGEDQALGNVLFNTFKLQPCASTYEPQTVLVTGGTLTFVDFGDVGS